MLPLADLNAFPALFRDYIKNVNVLQTYYNTHYTDAYLEKLIQQQNYRNIDRTTLFNVLSAQYQGISLHPQQKQNLNALKDANTFTVTTGHQLCLFGGPWFVAYKILATVQYAKMLQNQSEQYKIVPVFWLASEDHDIAEIQTLYTDTQKIHYSTNYQGITGNLPLKDIENPLDTLLHTLDKGMYANSLKQTLSQSYNSTFTLSKATRLFIQKLFGHLGMLVLDASVPELKSTFLSVAEKEIAEKTTYNTVQNTLSELHQLGYKTFANPSPVNLFYIYQNNLREKWNSKHALNPNRPEHISPNVLLRPVYQELVLPNLAYIGGPTEIAYWLQLKQTFGAFQIPFPVLVPRYFGVQLSAKQLRTLQKYELNLLDILNNPKEIFLARYFEKKLAHNHELTALEQEFQSWHTRILNFATNEKMGLEQAAMATVTRLEKQWKHFYTKIRKETQKRDTVFNQKIQDLYDTVLPFGNLQERTLSYLSTYAVYGNTLWENIMQKSVTEPYFWIWEV